jgi:hypothetical protein
MECLDSTYDVKVTHKSWPLGLLDKKISLKKSACEIEVQLNYYLLLHKKWLVDVCREPVHIKYKNSMITPVVLRRKGVCPKKDDGYCESIHMLEKIIQDNGLVYANGEKEQLGSDHGKVYCAYLLIKKYTNEGLIFSREKNYKNVIFPGSPALKQDNTMPNPASGAF